MNRPEPRKSSLAGSNPVAPRTDEPQQVETPPAPSATQRPARDTAPNEGVSTTKYPPKVSFYQDPADTNRMRAAILHTMALENYRNLSQFVDEAVREKVERLEKKYNGGQPFGSAGAGELPRGRTMGE